MSAVGHFIVLLVVIGWIVVTANRLLEDYEPTMSHVRPYTWPRDNSTSRSSKIYINTRTNSDGNGSGCDGQGYSAIVYRQQRSISLQKIYF